MFQSIPEGPWRGTLLLDRTPIVIYGDDRDIKKSFDFDSELPFTFTIGRTENDSLYAEFYNGKEKIRNFNITTGKSSISAKDTVRIDFLTFDTYLVAIYEDGVMEGNWVVNYKENYMIPFKAVFGQNHRFAHKTEKADYNVDGKWKFLFEPETPDMYPGIGDFTQKGNQLEGTVLTETGDYRFLEGNVIDNKFYLSAFDGAHAFLIVGKMMTKDSLVGSFRSGKHYTAEWLGFKDPTASLADPYQLTQVNETLPVSFSFPNIDDQLVTLQDKKFENKLKVVQIMGTWCPNCLDETHMLKAYFKNNPNKNVAWISLAFERYEDKEIALQQLKKYAKEQNLSHDILWAGSYKKDEASKQLPFLSEVKAYPTLLFVDRKNNIKHIHTGFSGPATKDYLQFEQEFQNLIENLENEE